MSTTPQLVPQGTGRTLHVFGGDVVTIKLGGAQTDGRLAMIETTSPPGAGTPPHVHHRESETFYILQSVFEFQLRGMTFRAKAGDVVHAPQDVPHCFRNVGDVDGKMVIVMEPAGFETFIAEFAEIPPDAPPDFARMAEIGARHGLEFLPSVDAAPNNR